MILDKLNDSVRRDVYDPRNEVDVARLEQERSMVVHTQAVLYRLLLAVEQDVVECDIDCLHFVQLPCLIQRQ
jgi:hypothetical protein